MNAPVIEGLSEEFIRKNEKYLKIIRGFRLLDDDFMSKVFEDKACADLLLQIILERDDLMVQEVHGQHDIKNLQGRSIRLDIYSTIATAMQIRGTGITSPTATNQPSPTGRAVMVTPTNEATAHDTMASHLMP